MDPINGLPYETQFCGAMHREQRFASFNASSLRGYPKHPTALNATFKRVRIPARVNDRPVLKLTIDTACDIPCIATDSLCQYPTLKTHKNVSGPAKRNKPA